jgi:hypothetical protein
LQQHQHNNGQRKNQMDNKDNSTHGTLDSVQEKPPIFYDGSVGMAITIL